MISFEKPGIPPGQLPSLHTFYPGLDGLRGIAILMVIGFHFFDFIPVFRYGWLGVDLFFVLSGFLITDILIKTRENKGYLRNFYMKRVLRIFPVYYLTLLVFIILLPAIREVPYNVSYYREYQSAFWLFLTNWLFIFKYTEETTILNHLWSLAVEEQFYFVWPWLILIFTTKKKLLRVLLFLGLFGISFRLGVLFLGDPQQNYEALYMFSRIDGLLVGAALAAYLQNHKWISQKIIRNFFILVALANLIFFFIKNMLRPHLLYFPAVGYTTYSLLFGLIVYKVITMKQGYAAIFLNNPVLRFFGKISYGLYVYHWPIYLLFYPGVKRYLQTYLPDNGTMVQLFGGCIIVVPGVVVSVASYFLIERRFLKLKTHFNKPPQTDRLVGMEYLSSRL